MARKKKKQKTVVSPEAENVFSIGAPEPVLGSALSDLLGCFLTGGNYYQPPINLAGLSRMRFASPHHGSAVAFKRNQMCRFFVETPVTHLEQFRAAALDYITFGNAYFQIVRNIAGGVSRLVHLPAIRMRRKKITAGAPEYCLLQDHRELSSKTIDFRPGEVLHIKDYDTGQTIYGLPEWLCGMQSILLNEDGTLFRRKYFSNGCHIGYILYTSDPTIDPKIEKEIASAVSSGKGIGNFKSMYINIPGGKEKGVQIIPVGDISQKDEFEKIKKITAADVIVAHRLPPELAGLMPENTAGFGDIEKTSRVYIENEVQAMVLPFQMMNRQLPANARFQFAFPEPEKKSS